MCGIAGIFNLDGESIEPELLYQMSSTLKHRGPDSQGFAFFPLAGNNFVVTEREKKELPFPCSLGLAHLRLAILDLSAKACQPMPNEDETLFLIFNGEIYNYKELRYELQAAGHQFRSESDAEVILHAYEQWGEECLNRFNGMWAFALWDSKKSSLFLSRDRFGVKPLYYLYKDNKLIFASEIKAILKIFSQAREPNHNSIYKFLTPGLQDDTEQTFFQNIIQLPPAHCMLINAQGRKLWNYWQLKEEDGGNIQEVEAIEKFLYLLKDAVRLRLRSDVPVGTCLSGGLDSSSIVTLATEISQQPFHTFSSVYEEKAYDESHFVDIIVKHCNTKPHYITPKPNKLFETLPTIVWHQDEPSNAPSIFAQWNVMELAAKEVKVLLDGQGGDEVLGGYHSFFLPYIADYLRNSINPKNWINLLRIFSVSRNINSISNQRYVKLFLSLVSPQMVHEIEKFVDKNRVAINADYLKSLSNKSPFEPAKKFSSSKLNNWLYRTLTQYSLPGLLHYEDRNSMAFSIEVRNPFLDYRLVEFLFQLPFDYKIRNATTKYILRKALKGIMPNEIVNRKDKQGFPMPAAIWFKNELKDDVRAILISDTFRNRGIFNQKKVMNIFEAHCQDIRDYSWYIWRWINLELWFQRFIDKPI